MNQNFNKEKIDFIVSCINSKMSIFYDVLNEARESIISDIKKLNHVLSEMCETMGEDKLEAFKRRLTKSSRYIWIKTENNLSYPIIDEKLCFCPDLMQLIADIVIITRTIQDFSSKRGEAPSIDDLESVKIIDLILLKLNNYLPEPVYCGELNPINQINSNLQDEKELIVDENSFVFVYDKYNTIDMKLKRGIENKNYNPHSDTSGIVRGYLDIDVVRKYVYDFEKNDYVNENSNYHRYEQTFGENIFDTVDVDLFEKRIRKRVIIEIDIARLWKHTNWVISRYESDYYNRKDTKFDYKERYDFGDVAQLITLQCLSVYSRIVEKKDVLHDIVRVIENYANDYILNSKFPEDVIRVLGPRSMKISQTRINSVKIIEAFIESYKFRMYGFPEHKYTGIKERVYKSIYALFCTFYRIATFVSSCSTDLRDFMKLSNSVNDIVTKETLNGIYDFVREKYCVFTGLNEDSYSVYPKVRRYVGKAVAMSIGFIVVQLVILEELFCNPNAKAFSTDSFDYIDGNIRHTLNLVSDMVSFFSNTSNYTILNNTDHKIDDEGNISGFDSKIFDYMIVDSIKSTYNGEQRMTSYIYSNFIRIIKDMSKLFSKKDAFVIGCFKKGRFDRDYSDYHSQNVLFDNARCSLNYVYDLIDS